jgi:hypothetical protein
MKPAKYSCLSSEWSINLGTGTFSSPSKDTDRPDQIVIFNTRVKDGFMSASITPISGQWNNESAYEFREGALMFRYTDKENFYVAGIGGFGVKFYIAKVSESEWRLLANTGHANHLKSKVQYDLRVEFYGDRITLFCSDVPVLSAFDSSHSSGFCGLRTNRTEAKFENVDITAELPKCFVIMPFAAEFDFVYSVIKKTVEEHDFKCERADERYISEPIVENVKSKIVSAEIVIVDFTGMNTNVYFEAGLADAWKKKWIVLAQSPSDLAFDVQHVRAIMYSNSMGADENLKEALRRALQETLGAAASNRGS